MTIDILVYEIGSTTTLVNAFDGLKEAFESITAVITGEKSAGSA